MYGIPYLCTLVLYTSSKDTWIITYWIKITVIKGSCVVLSFEWYTVDCTSADNDMWTLFILCLIHVIKLWHTNFPHQACGTVMSFHYCVKKLSWRLNAITTLLCHVSAGPLRPTNLFKQNEVNITQCYSQMSGTNKPECASILFSGLCRIFHELQYNIFDFDFWLW